MAKAKPKFNKHILEDYSGDPLKELPLSLSLIQHVPKSSSIPIKDVRMDHYDMDVPVHGFYKSISKSIKKTANE